MRATEREGGDSRLGPRTERVDRADTLSEDADQAEAGDDAQASIRVGIVFADDHRLLAGAIGVALNMEPELRVVGVGATTTTGLLRDLAVGVDVILVDSVSIVTRLKAASPDVQVVVVGEADNPAVILSCVRAGAAACVGNNTSTAQLADIIRRAHAGERAYDLAALMSVLLRPDIWMASQPRRTATLTERELGVLRSISQGLSTAEAAVHLGITMHTLRSHLKNILVKLEVRSTLEAVLVAIREGRIELPND